MRLLLAVAFLGAACASPAPHIVGWGPWPYEIPLRSGKRLRTHVIFLDNGDVRWGPAGYAVDASTAAAGAR